MLLWELQDWAQGLKAEMDLRGTPCSSERAQYMLQEHRAYKVSRSPKVLGLSNVSPSLPPHSSDLSLSPNQLCPFPSSS